METAAASPNFAGDRSEIGGYAVVHTLVPEQSWLATATGGRKVVLKALDEDCMWKGQLHPSVKDRLGRVRELAHAGVANLYGVERDDGLTYLVWDYVDGRTLAEFAASEKCGPRELMVVARELVLAVEMLHTRGIVHGAVKGANAIVGTDGRVVITHVSPLLYTEPGDDVRAVLTVLGELVESRGETGSPLGRLLGQAVEDEGATLRRLAARIGALLDVRESEPGVEREDRTEGRRIRRRALAGAAATAALGIAVFVGMRQYAKQQSPQRPEPPRAPPSAMQPTKGESPSAAAPAGWPTRRAVR
jgi:hypothetical protein